MRRTLPRHCRRSHRQDRRAHPRPPPAHRPRVRGLGSAGALASCATSCASAGASSPSAPRPRTASATCSRADRPACDHPGSRLPHHCDARRRARRSAPLPQQPERGWRLGSTGGAGRWTGQGRCHDRRRESCRGGGLADRALLVEAHPARQPESGRRRRGAALQVAPIAWARSASTRCGPGRLVSRPRRRRPSSPRRSSRRSTWRPPAPARRRPARVT